MSAPAETATTEGAAGPRRRPASRFLNRVPEAFATFFGALALLCVLLALILDTTIVLIGRRLTTWQRAVA